MRLVYPESLHVRNNLPPLILQSMTTGYKILGSYFLPLGILIILFLFFTKSIAVKSLIVIQLIPI